MTRALGAELLKLRTARTYFLRMDLHGKVALAFDHQIIRILGHHRRPLAHVSFDFRDPESHGYREAGS